MNRKQKIIVSVTGIFLVLLIIVGLTYAYFLTQIKGNTNNKSISVTTANLILTYGDGNGVLETGDKLRPGSSVNFKTSNGTTVNEKTFTVTNSGDETSYVVIVDNVNVTPEPFESNDFRYTLTCSSSDSNLCDGTTDSIFPLKNQSILVGNKIAAGTTHTYTLTMEYKETGENQSNDMGKTFTARVNIADVAQMENPFMTGVTATDNASLTYNIIKNAKDNKNGTSFLNTPKTNIAESISQYGTGEFGYETVSTGNLCSGYDPWLVGDSESAAQSGSTVSSYEDAVGKYVYDQCDSWTKKLLSYDSSTGTLTFDNQVEIKKDEQTLSVTQDDYGISYYYRGNVEDNYVNFVGMCWRIVRIDGNGNIKIVLEDKNTTCDSSTYTGNYVIGEGNYGYEQTSKPASVNTLYKMNYLEPVTKAEESMVKAFYDYQSTLNTKISNTYTNKIISDYLVSGKWCMADTTYKQSGSSRLYTYTPTSLEEYNYNLTMYYDSYVRLSGYNIDGYNPTLKCTGQVIDKFKNHTVDGTTITTETDMYVGTLTADEIVYAGGKHFSSNVNYYLVNDYQEKNFINWRSLSPAIYDNSGNGVDKPFIVFNEGYINYYYSYFNDSLRPAINLKAGVEIVSGGTGTKDNPYIIK